jgi:phage N-6-adenine-methyltransferase
VSFVSRNHPQQVGVRGALDEIDDRTTPWELFTPIAERFGGFTLDAAAAPHNARCAKYYTRHDNGLMRSWDGERVWCNPPYSDLGQWVAKARAEAMRADLIVMLLPANRTEQAWWQDHVEPYRDGRHPTGPRIEFLRGRLRFIKPGQTEIRPNERPPFGCLLAIWEPTVQLALPGMETTV